MYSIPVLFLIFNRPDTTQLVFNRIREIQPKKLYIAADAARVGRSGEFERCSQARSIVDAVDWPCEVKRLYRNDNLGCKFAVSSAITWFFDQEEYGVILEDDCLPDLSFFPFCEELLLKYKDDDRIGHISGNCFLLDLIDKRYSYDFCSFSHIWGWASWRRVWKNYDLNFLYWKEAKDRKSLRNSLFNSLCEEIYFSSFISDALDGRNKINTWDTQYLFMLRVNSQLSIYPSVNLVTNIGLGDPNSTHTTKKNKKVCLPTLPVKFPLSHPEYIISNSNIDDTTVKRFFFSYKRLLRYIVNFYCNIGW